MNEWIKRRREWKKPVLACLLWLLWQGSQKRRFPSSKYPPCNGHPQSKHVHVSQYFFPLILIRINKINQLVKYEDGLIIMIIIINYFFTEKLPIRGSWHKSQTQPVQYFLSPSGM